MRHLHKVISREHIISRLPSVWPAYNGDEIYFFDSESIAERDNEYQSNYGLVPLSVKLSGISITDGNIEVLLSPGTADAMIGVCGLSGGCTTSAADCYDLSFERIAKMYSFFVDYYTLLKTKGYCGQVYSTAVEYYETENTYNKQNSLYYGNDEQTYIDLDATFNSYGGKLMFDWICTYVMPTFKIPDAWRDAWGTSFLYYPDALYWYAWLNDKRELYSGYAGNCSASTDCCECEKYFDLGGGVIRPQLQNWYNNVQSAITEVKNIIKRPGTAKCFSPSIEMQIELQNSIENVGYFDLILSEAKLGEDYYGTRAVVLHNGLPLMKNDKSAHYLGYKFDAKYQEMTFDDLAWSSYTRAYSSGYSGSDGHAEEFYNPYLYYAFLSNDKKIVGKTIASVNEQCFIAHDIIEGDWVLNIDDELLYSIDTKEVGHYNDGLVVVYREKYTQTPYVIIRGKEIYGVLKGGQYEFPFMDDTFDRTYHASNAVDYIVEGGIVKVVDSLLTNENYVRVIAYCDAAEKTFYSKDGEETGYCYTTSAITNPEMDDVLEQRVFVQDPMSVFDVLSHVMKLYERPTIYQASSLTGYTSSKLMPLKSANLLSDDVGNMIEGINPHTTDGLTANNAQPYEGQTLEPVYQVKNYANIQKFSLNNGKDAFKTSGLTVGDIITDMVVYYKDSQGNEIAESRTTCERNEVLEAISIAYDMATEATTDTIDKDVVWCDITYRIGATLSGSTSGMKAPNAQNQGVEYTETVKMVKENAMYCLRRQSDDKTPSVQKAVSSHTVSYPISIYKVYQQMETVYSDTYGSEYEVPVAKFKASLPTYSSGGTMTVKADMEENNGVEVYPVFMQPYGIGISMPKNVSSSIYIDRGINAALDRHLKLGEVLSLEAMENYGNNFFNITNSER